MILPVQVVAQVTTEWKLEWLSAPPLWVIFLLLFPAAAALSWFLYRHERGSLTPSWRTGLAVLRFLLFFLLLCVLFEPVYSLIRREERSAYVLVLVDKSHSMGYSDEWSGFDDPEKAVAVFGPAASTGSVRRERLSVVKRVLTHNDGAWLKQLGEKGRLRIIAFDREHRILSTEDIPRGDTKAIASALSAVSALDAEGRTGDETHIANAVQEAVLSLRGKRIAAIVVFSDWRQTGGDLTLEGLPAQLRRPEGTIPVMSVGVGIAAWPQDTRIDNFTGPDRALSGDKVSFTVTCSGQGCEPGAARRLDLLVNGLPAGVTEFPVIKEGGSGTVVRLEHRFQESGVYEVTAKLQPFPGEVDASNNVETRQIEIKDQSLKVLYVENLPRWDYRYLKNFLARSPTIQFQALLLSADPRFRQETSMHPPLAPLTDFPHTRAELFSYDVLILGDVDPTGVFSNEDLDNIRAFVAEGGGGVIFIAGMNYNPHAYAHTPLAEAMPVEAEDFGGRAALDTDQIEEPFRVKLTPEGKEHPIMRFVSDSDRNLDLWENTDGIEENSLPGFWWFAPVLRLKKGAIALGIHPEKRHIRYGNRVIFACQIYGKGRSFFSAVDSTWRWRAGVGGTYFNYFWGQVIRYVAASRLRGETARYQINVHKTVYNPGGQVIVTGRILDEELRPSTRNECEAVLVKNGEETSRLTLTLKQDDPTRPGIFTGSIEAGGFGVYTLFFKEAEEARTTFRVVVPQKERRDIRLDREAARKVAQQTGGAYYRVVDVDRIPGNVVQVSQELSMAASRHPIWSRWWVLVVLAGLASLEWGLRKFRRLL